MLHSDVQVANSVVASVKLQYIPHFLNDLTSQAAEKQPSFGELEHQSWEKRKSVGEKKTSNEFKACTAQT